MLTRRQFLKLGAGAAAGLMFSRGSHLRAPSVLAYESINLDLFAQPLRGVGPGGIPVAAPDPGPAPVTGATHYSMNISEFPDTLHPSLGPTTLRGFNPVRPLGGGSQPQRHLGGIIVAKKGQPIQVTFTNTLPNDHILPVDTTIMGAGMGVAGPKNSTSVHLHGGLVPWISDGGPRATWAPGGYLDVSAQAGPYGNIFKILNPNLQNNQAEYYYPNNQSARFVWYHDHAFGYTRLNAYAGIASAYIIRDSLESNLRNFGFPDFVENGGREIPIVVQDKVFVGPDIAGEDSSWLNVTPARVHAPGSLWYPHINEDGGSDPSVVPEMFGDTMLANGVVAPFAKVAPALYRLRVLNACQSRFLNLQLYVADDSPNGITIGSDGKPKNKKGPDFFVIGTEGGFLVKPVTVPSNRPFNPATMGGSLITGPAERWDLLVDFSGFNKRKIVLYNDAPAPFPSGDDSNDIFPGNGLAPNTRVIMRFDVEGNSVPGDAAFKALQNSPLFSENRPFPVPLGVAVQNGSLSLPAGVKVRKLTLNEDVDELGRLLQLLGTNEATAPGKYGRAYTDASTENPKDGATEVWQIANLSADTHPIHFHLVNCLILARQPFNVDAYDGTPQYTGPARGPESTEWGWKETVKMHPGEVTTVIMTFDVPKVPFLVPSSPNGGGNEYVWHCHILEHEEHDMMRPLIVI